MFINNLPYEVLTYIFSYTGQYKGIISHVCRLWSLLIADKKLLWSSILSIPLLRWAKYNKCPWNEKTTYYTLQNNSPILFKWLIRKKCPYDSNTLILLLVKRNFCLLKWLDSKRKIKKQYITKSVLEHLGQFGNLKYLNFFRKKIRLQSKHFYSINIGAVKGGSVQLLDYFYKNNLSLNSNLCYFYLIAGRNNQLITLNWLYTKFIPIDIDIVTEIITPHIKIKTLQWFISHQFTIKYHKLYQQLIKYNLFDILIYFHTKKPILSKKMFNTAATFGHLEIIKWLHENKCPSLYVCNYAVRSGNLDVVKWLLINNYLCNYNSMLYLATKYNHLHIIKWLNTHYI